MSLFICELLQKPRTAAGNRKSKAARKFHVNQERNKKVLGADVFLSVCTSRPHGRLCLDKGPEACRVERTGVVQQPCRTLGFLPDRQNIQGATGCSRQKCSFPGWPGHSLHTWEQTCRSSPCGSRLCRPSHEILPKENKEHQLLTFTYGQPSSGETSGGRIILPVPSHTAGSCSSFCCPSCPMRTHAHAYFSSPETEREKKKILVVSFLHKQLFPLELLPSAVPVISPAGPQQQLCLTHLSAAQGGDCFPLV